MLAIKALTTYRETKKTFKDTPTTSLKKYIANLQKLIKEREETERLRAEKAQAERQQIEEFEALMKEANINPETFISHLSAQKKRKRRTASNQTHNTPASSNQTIQHQESQA